MESVKARSSTPPWVWLVMGSLCFTFVGWRFNVPLAAWLAPVFLIRFFRDRGRWFEALAAVPLLAVGSFIQMNGGWDLDPWMVYLFSVLRPAAFVIALFVDRALYRKRPKTASTLVYPTVYLVVDYAMALTPLGSGMSASATQFGFPAIAGLASIAGIWGIGFLMGWFAACLNTLWENEFDFAKGGKTPAVAVAVLIAAVAFGSARYALIRPSSPTVRIGSVTVEHPRDYWNWIDQGTPRKCVSENADELLAIEDELFNRSARAITAGAKIVFWSEGNGVIPEDREKTFTERASAFARENGVYFAPGVVVLRYGQTISDNKIMMFAPDGSLAYTYVKTKSWYPTGSDGVLKTVDTPYGRIGSAICFDMDFPSFVHDLGAKQTDIVLVPAFDTERIRPYHTEVGLMRALENGFSVVRQVNKGTSMAVDGSGRVLGRQEFFETQDRLMIVDVPTRRVSTLYSAVGEWLAYAGVALAVLFVIRGAAKSFR